MTTRGQVLLSTSCFISGTLCMLGIMKHDIGDIVIAVGSCVITVGAYLLEKE